MRRVVATGGSVCPQRSVLFPQRLQCAHKYSYYLGSCGLDYRLVEVPGALRDGSTHSPWSSLKSESRINRPFYWILRYIQSIQLGRYHIHSLLVRLCRPHSLQHDHVMPAPRQRNRSPGIRTPTRRRWWRRRGRGMVPRRPPWRRLVQSSATLQQEFTGRLEP